MKAPVSTLLAAGLSATAKIIWLSSALTNGDMTPAALAAAGGLTVPTIRRGLAELAAAGLTPGAPSPPGRTVEMSTALLAARRVGAQAKVIYGLLQLAPGFCRQEFSGTYKALCSLARVRQATRKAQLDDLVFTGWLRMRVTREKGSMVPHFVLLDPEFYRQRLLLVQARRRLGRAEYKGEALMREWLSVLVSTELFADEASPG